MLTLEHVRMPRDVRCRPHQQVLLEGAHRSSSPPPPGAGVSKLALIKRVSSALEGTQKLSARKWSPKRLELAMGAKKLYELHQTVLDAESVCEMVPDTLHLRTQRQSATELACTRSERKGSICLSSAVAREESSGLPS
eukprot:6213844-Pleurochrysis_carterae.AAC.5